MVPHILCSTLFLPLLPSPSPPKVLMKKAQFANMLLFQKMRVGIYVFQHKTIANLKYVLRGGGA